MAIPETVGCAPRLERTASAAAHAASPPPLSLSQWTPHATYAATRIFASNFNPAKAQRFFNLVLLPKARDDVQAHGRMNFHLYLALKKATCEWRRRGGGETEDGTPALASLTVASLHSASCRQVCGVLQGRPAAAR